MATPPDLISLNLIPSAPTFDDDCPAPFQSQLLNSTLNQAPQDAAPIYPDFSGSHYAPVAMDVKQFFTDPQGLYSCPIVDESPTPSINLEEMPIHPTTTAFNPHILTEENRYILSWINQIAEAFIKHHQSTSTRETLDLAEQFVSQFMSQVVLRYASSELLSTQPFFPCLEISLRAHLFHKIIGKEQSVISETFRTHKKFPDGLGEIEEKLFKFLTKDTFFSCYATSLYDNSFNGNFLFNGFVLGDPLSFLEKSCISKIISLPAAQAADLAEEVLEKTLKDCNLPQTSGTALIVNFFLRRKVGLELVAKQAYEFKLQFQKTGVVSQQNFNTIAGKIFSIVSGNGLCYANFHIKHGILVQLFDVQNTEHNNPSAFQVLESQKNAEISALPNSSRAARFFSSLVSSKIPKQQLLQSQLGTLGWAKSEWEAAFLPPPSVPGTDAPLETSNSIDPDLEGFEIIEPSQVPVPSIEPQPIVPETATIFQPGLEPDPIVPQITAPSQPGLEPDPMIPQIPLPSEQPAVRAQRPPMPLPVELAIPIPPPSYEAPKPEPVRFTVNSSNIPLVSYINLACKEAIEKAGEDFAFWNSLPPLIQRDALRHCCYLYGCQGKVEEVACRLFKQVPTMQYEIFRLEANGPLVPEIRKLSPAFIEKGEYLLNLYYSSNKDKFYQEFYSLPPEPLFYQYIYEMANAAGIHIEGWDHHFAENNWKNPNMMRLCLQALERCLHTNSP